MRSIPISHPFLSQSVTHSLALTLPSGCDVIRILYQYASHLWVHQTSEYFFIELMIIFVNDYLYCVQRFERQEWTFWRQNRHHHWFLFQLCQSTCFLLGLAGFALFGKKQSVIFRCGRIPITDLFPYTFVCPWFFLFVRSNVLYSSESIDILYLII